VYSWTQINGSPSAWINAGVNNGNGPHGTSPIFSVTNTQNVGLFFLASPQFPLQASSTYAFTFYVANSGTDNTWPSYVTAQIACGSMTVATAVMSQATSAGNSYLLSSTTFDTTTSTDPLVLGQLANCQVQIVFHHGLTQVNTWFLADVGASYVGVVASPPPASTSVP
jgi:hypothetical protein